MKRILIPNGSFHDIPLIQKAKEMGFYVITSGAAPEGIGHKYADEYVFCDFSEKEALLKVADEMQVDQVCSNCNDFGYLSACFIAEKMGFEGHEPYDTAERLHHKDRFKELAQDLALSTPPAKSFWQYADAKAYLQDVEYPVIIKPSDLGAGQGITRADNYKTAIWAANNAFRLAKNKRIIIEPFIEGTSHSFNAFVVGGKVRGFYSDNEYMKYTPYRVSTSGGPADGIEGVLPVLIADTEKVAQALSLPDGLMHSQYIMDSEGRAHILEITRRMSGDWYPYPEMRATGVDWVEYIVKSQCGEDVSDFPADVMQKGYMGRHCLNAPKKGMVTGVRYKPELEKYIFDSTLWLDGGFEVRDLVKDYPGIIFFDFDDRERMMRVLAHIDEYIEFKYV